MTEENEYEHFLSIKQVARMLGVSVRSVRNYIKMQGLQAVRMNARGPYRISVKALNAWLDEHKTKKGDDQ